MTYRWYGRFGLLMRTFSTALSVWRGKGRRWRVKTCTISWNAALTAFLMGLGLHYKCFVWWMSVRNQGWYRCHLSFCKSCYSSLRSSNSWRRRYESWQKPWCFPTSHHPCGFTWMRCHQGIWSYSISSHELQSFRLRRIEYRFQGLEVADMPLFMKQASMVNETSFNPQRNYFRLPLKPVSFFRAVLIKK